MVSSDRLTPSFLYEWVVKSPKSRLIAKSKIDELRNQESQKTDEQRAAGDAYLHLGLRESGVQWIVRSGCERISVANVKLCDCQTVSLSAETKFNGLHLNPLHLDEKDTLNVNSQPFLPLQLQSPDEVFEDEQFSDTDSGEDTIAEIVDDLKAFVQDMNRSDRTEFEPYFHSETVSGNPIPQYNNVHSRQKERNPHQRKVKTVCLCFSRLLRIFL